jgi:hypothetical protein
MYGDYGTDDVAWLESVTRRSGTVPIGDHDLPFARFDNRDDLTSFLRADPAEWTENDVARVHTGLATALASLDMA